MDEDRAPGRADAPESREVRQLREYLARVRARNARLRELENSPGLRRDITRLPDLSDWN
jgi:hypothetical protein